MGGLAVDLDLLCVTKYYMILGVWIGVFRICGCFVLLSGCSRSNNLLLGRVEAKAGAHRVMVTDCYRTRVAPPERLADTAGGEPAYRFTPCRDADVLISGYELFVNGQSYGQIGPNDSILVDHGVVLVNERPARANRK